MAEAQSQNAFDQAFAAPAAATGAGTATAATTSTAAGSPPAASATPATSADAGAAGAVGAAGAGTGGNAFDQAFSAADTAAAAPPTAQQAGAAPSWRDRIVGALTAPKAGHDNSTILGRAANWAEIVNPQIADWRQSAGGVAELALHPVDTVKAIGSQVADAEVLGIAGKEGYEHAMAKPETQRNYDDNRVIQAANNFKAMGHAMWQQFLDDPQKFVNEQVGQAAVMHGAEAGAGAAWDLTKQGMYKVGQTAGELVRNTAGTDGAAAANLANKTKTFNDRADARAVAANDKKVQQNQAQGQRVGAENDRRGQAFQDRVDNAYQKHQQDAADAQQKVTDQNAADLQSHMAKVDQAGKEDARRQAMYDSRVQSAQMTHEEAQSQFEQAQTEAQDTESERGRLQAEKLATVNQLGEAHLVARDGARSSIARQASDVASKISDVAGQKQSLAQSMFQKGYAELAPEEKLQIADKVTEAKAPMANILEAVGKARETDLKGSETDHPLFKSIERYAEDRQAGNSPTVDFNPKSNNTPRSMMYMEVLTGNPHTAYEKLGEQAKANYDAWMKGDQVKDADPIVGDGTGEAGEAGEAAAGSGAGSGSAAEAPAPGGEAIPQIPYSQLSGYITEIGKRIRQLKASTEHPGDVIAGLERVQAAAEATAAKMAKDAGPDVVHARNEMRRQYRVYRETFMEPDQDSPTAKATQAAANFPKANNWRAAHQYLTTDELATGRAKGMLVGTEHGPEATPHYQPEAGKLVENLQRIHREQQDLTGKKTMAKRVQAAQARAAKPAPVAEVPGQPAAPGTVRRLSSETPKLSPEPPTPRPIPEPVQGPLKPNRPIGERPLPTPRPLTDADMVRPNYINMTPDKLAKLNGKAIADRVQKLKGQQIKAMGKIVTGGAVTLGGLAAAVLHPSTTGIVFESLGAAAGGKAVLSGLSTVATKLALSHPAMIEMLKQPSRVQLEQFMNLPEAQRPGVVEAIQQMNAEAVKTGKLSKPSPWLSILASFGINTRAAQQRQQDQKDKTAADAAQAASDAQNGDTTTQ